MAAGRNRIARYHIREGVAGGTPALRWLVSVACASREWTVTGGTPVPRS